MEWHEHSREREGGGKEAAFGMAILHREGHQEGRVGGRKVARERIVFI